MSFPAFSPSGDSALLVTFGEAIDLAANRRAHALAARLAEAPLAGLGEAVPGYTTLLVHYDPLEVGYERVLAWVQACLREPAAGTAGMPEPRRIEVPVIYGGEHGPDL